MVREKLSFKDMRAQASNSTGLLGTHPSYHSAHKYLYRYPLHLCILPGPSRSQVRFLAASELWEMRKTLLSPLPLLRRAFLFQSLF